MQNICRKCGTEFWYGRTAGYCSHKCRLSAYHKRNYVPSTYAKQGIDKLSVGAGNELRVAADLLFRGYEVFRALSPHASCDLAILKDNKLLRVEVRSGRPSLSGGVPYWPKAKRKTGLYDVWAVALPDQVIYLPDGVIT